LVDKPIFSTKPFTWTASEKRFCTNNRGIAVLRFGEVGLYFCRCLKFNSQLDVTVTLKFTWSDFAFWENVYWYTPLLSYLRSQTPANISTLPHLIGSVLSVTASTTTPPVTPTVTTLPQYYVTPTTSSSAAPTPGL